MIAIELPTTREFQHGDDQYAIILKVRGLEPNVIFKSVEFKNFIKSFLTYLSSFLLKETTLDSIETHIPALIINIYNEYSYVCHQGLPN